MAAYRDILFRGLDRGQIDALDVLAEHGSCRMSDLAEAMRIARSTATRALERLEVAGLARRERASDPEHGSSVRASLTATGSDLQRLVAERRLAMVQEIVREFEAREVAQLAVLMEKLVRGYDRVVELAAATDEMAFIGASSESSVPRGMHVGGQPSP